VDRSGKEGEEDRSPKSRHPRRSAKISIPVDFNISERVRAWAVAKGYGDLDRHLEAFRSKAIAKAYAYADWDEAFMGAVRDDWAKVRVVNGTHRANADADIFAGAR
jgi:hypothetical protein